MFFLFFASDMKRKPHGINRPNKPRKKRIFLWTRQKESCVMLTYGGRPLFFSNRFRVEMFWIGKNQRDKKKCMCECYVQCNGTWHEIRSERKIKGIFCLFNLKVNGPVHNFRLFLSPPIFTLNFNFVFLFYFRLWVVSWVVVDVSERSYRIYIYI